MRGHANTLFSLQLGQPWAGVDGLPIHVQALFGIFAARFNRDRDGANALLLQIAQSSGSGKLNFAGARELCHRHGKSKPIRRLFMEHAYVLTVMASLLEMARLDGVMASADFIWLKPLDRRLWYMLNNVGRQTAFVEVAGPFAHWLAEKALGRKIITPFIEEATTALELAIQEIIYIPDKRDDDILMQDNESLVG